MKQNISDNDLFKIYNLDKRMRTPSNIVANVENDLKNKDEINKLKNPTYFENDSFSLFDHKEFSLEINEKEIDKENDIPLEEKEEEKYEFSLENYDCENRNEDQKENEMKRKADRNIEYYPIFKKLKTSDENPLKIFCDDKNGYSENSNDVFHLNSIKNNRKITEYFKKQMNQKNFVQSLMNNECLKVYNLKEENLKTNTKILPVVKQQKDNHNRLKQLSLRKISFGDSNSNTELVISNNSNDKRLKEKEKNKILKNVAFPSAEKISNENFKLKDEIRKLNKKLVDKDAILKNEEIHLRHLSTENKALNEKITYYEQQIVVTFQLVFLNYYIRTNRKKLRK